jgi:hypothetical protein
MKVGSLIATEFGQTISNMRKRIMAFNVTQTEPQAKSPQPILLYPSDSLRHDLMRVHDVWRETQRQHDRFSVYQYLTAVFDLVMVWKKENRAVNRATRALQLKGRNVGPAVEPFAAIISCTSSRKRVDAKARSKWARVLMFAAEYKSPRKPLDDFIRRYGGINLSAAEYTRRLGLPRP